jgi:hypothetical protein
MPQAFIATSSLSIERRLKEIKTPSKNESGKAEGKIEMAMKKVIFPKR